MKNDDFGSGSGHRHDSRIVLVKDLGDDREIKRINTRRVFVSIAVIIAAVMAVVIMVYAVRTLMHRHAYSSMKVLSQTELSGMEDASYADYAKGVIRYGCNGAEYINADGRVVWNAAYEMKHPVVKTEGDYAVIADYGGYSFTICGINGTVSDNSVERTIINADISSGGTVCIGTDDESSDYVNFYDKEGRRLDIEIKTVLAGDGYPMDMEISPDGQMLMMSYMYLNEGIMQNKVVFYNFSELGQNYSDRLVGVFNDFGESVVPEVRMLSDEYACAFADDRINFYSLENPTKPALIASFGYDEEIKSVFSSDKYVGIISSSSDGMAGESLDIYTISGKTIANAGISFEYDEVKLFDDLVVLNNSSHLSIYTVDGSLKYSGQLDSIIDYVTCTKNSRLMKFGGGMLSEIKLKY